MAGQELHLTEHELLRIDRDRRLANAARRAHRGPRFSSRCDPSAY